MSPPDSLTPPAQHATAARVISQQAVQILAGHTGRGPTTVRTYFNEDLVTILFQDLLTTGEKTLTKHAKHETVLEGRRALQDAMREALVAAVELATGRKVVAFLSANHLDPDVEIEGFLLERVGG